jgi:E-phenylitaconyl-CoA hydratase
MAIDLHLDADGIATITMNRPERLNALNLEHYQALSNAWTRVRDDAGARSLPSGVPIAHRMAR